MSFFHQHVLDKKRWGRLRLKVLDAANWKCRICGNWSGEVDHVRPLHQNGAVYDLENLQAICADHHRAKTRQELRKVAPDQKEWQDFMGARYGESVGT